MNKDTDIHDALCYSCNTNVPKKMFNTHKPKGKVPKPKWIKCYKERIKAGYTVYTIYDYTLYELQQIINFAKSKNFTPRKPR